MSKYFLTLLFIFSFSDYIYASRGPLVIGSKKFTESVILGELSALVLEKKFNIKVIRKFNLGGTQITLEALKSGSIHLYPEYTGTGYVMVLKQGGLTDADAVYEIVNKEFQERWQIEWSKPIGFNNTYALAVRKNDSRFIGVDTISQLPNNGKNLYVASGHEFMERNDGFDNLVDAYSLKFSSSKTLAMEAGLMYQAVRDSKVDIIIAYSTDGRIKSFDLKLLSDNLNFFPPYHASYLAKQVTLEKYPELRKLYKLFSGLITESEMVDLNNKVDHLQLDPKTVAWNFLINKGVIKAELLNQSKDENFFAFLIRKRQYLIKICREHLVLSLLALMLSLLLSVPLGILLTRYVTLAKIIFPIINSLQTIPSLALLGILVPIMGIGFWPALLALFIYSLLPLVRNTYVGISSIDRDLIEASQGVGLTDFQVLYLVEIPIALPMILAGIRTAAVIVIGSATLAAMIGAGGLGDPIFRGVATVNNNLILLGAIPAAAMAILVDKMLGLLEKLLVSKGLRLASKR
ncbi:MAG: ABC transporter permease subunit [Bdellovibrionaceae bacterium]|nr:ABC transporter permease subunit [Pseudobdellovibrionaceae bacterium]